MQVQDIIETQDKLKSHEYPFYLWPQKWQAFTTSNILAWNSFRLSNDQRINIPSEPGIYSLLIQPAIANHSNNSFLMYIGQAISLNSRFADYLGSERREQGRPKIFRLLNKYSDYIWFCYTKCPRIYLNDVENRLIDAFIPPCNDQYPVTLRKVRGAFK